MPGCPAIHTGTATTCEGEACAGLAVVLKEQVADAVELILLCVYFLKADSMAPGWSSTDGSLVPGSIE